jgi:hypothetical protein
MVKWLLIGGALFLVWIWYSNSGGTLANPAPKQTPATNANAGFGVTVGASGVNIKW